MTCRPRAVRIAALAVACGVAVVLTGCSTNGAGPIRVLASDGVEIADATPRLGAGDEAGVLIAPSIVAALRDDTAPAARLAGGID